MQSGYLDHISKAVLYCGLDNNQNQYKRMAVGITDTHVKTDIIRLYDSIVLPSQSQDLGHAALSLNRVFTAVSQNSPETSFTTHLSEANWREHIREISPRPIVIDFSSRSRVWHRTADTRKQLEKLVRISPNEIP